MRFTILTLLAALIAFKVGYRVLGIFALAVLLWWLLLRATGVINV